MSKTVLIILSTVLVLGLTLLVTNILSRRKKTDLADWEVGGRDLPYYVVIGTQFATAMGGGVLVGHVGNAYNFGLSILLWRVQLFHAAVHRADRKMAAPQQLCHRA